MYKIQNYLAKQYISLLIQPIHKWNPAYDHGSSNISYSNSSSIKQFWSVESNY